MSQDLHFLALQFCRPPAYHWVRGSICDYCESLHERALTAYSAASWHSQGSHFLATLQCHWGKGQPVIVSRSMNRRAWQLSVTMGQRQHCHAEHARTAPEGYGAAPLCKGSQYVVQPAVFCSFTAASGRRHPDIADWRTFALQNALSRATLSLDNRLSTASTLCANPCRWSFMARGKKAAWRTCNTLESTISAS